MNETKSSETRPKKSISKKVMALILGIVVVGATVGGMVLYFLYHPAWVKVLDTNRIGDFPYTSEPFVIDGNNSYIKVVEWQGAQNVWILYVNIYYNGSRELAYELTIDSNNSTESFPLFNGTFYLTIAAYAPYLPAIIPFTTRLQVWESQP